MTWLDWVLRARRYRQARSWIPEGARLLDVGTHDGSFLDYLGDRIGPSVGVDPSLVVAPALASAGHRLVAGTLSDLEVVDPFDAASALAVFEHLDGGELRSLDRELRGVVAPGGRLVATVPSPRVDPILDALVRLGLTEGLDAQGHHGATAEEVVDGLEEAGWELVHRKRFEVGLNHLLVFS
jgi:SAM-dependent methyltransferase